MTILIVVGAALLGMALVIVPYMIGVVTTRRALSHDSTHRKSTESHRP